MTKEKAITIIENCKEQWQMLLREDLCDEIEGRELIEAFDMALSTLSDMRPNIHAHWEPIGEAFQCSHCGTLCAVTETATHWIWHINDKFCRGCGAVMDEKGDEV